MTYALVDGPTNASTTSDGARSLPKLTGYLQGGVPDGDFAPADLADLTEVSSVTVEFYHGHNPELETYPVDGISITDVRGHFEYTPRGLTGAVTTIYARTRLTVPGTTTIVYGDVEQVGVLLAAPDLPTLPSLELVDPYAGEFDYGTWRWVTSDPRTTGTLIQADEDGIGFQSVLIEFAHDYNGVNGDEETVVGYALPDATGKFIYAPVVMSTAADGAIKTGDVKLRARVAYYDDLAQGMAYGTWINLTTDLTVQLPTNDPATVEDLDVLNVSSIVTEFKHTFEPTITGRVEDPEGYAAFVQVNIYNGTDVFLGTTTTDVNGRFVYTLQGQASGSVTVKARAREWDYVAGAIAAEGSWSAPFTFVLEPTIALDVATFGLQSNTGSSPTDAITANPLLIGQIGGTGPLGNVSVAIDVGDDGVDAIVLTDSEGRFFYLPPTLDLGTYTVRAKVATWDAVAQAFTYSEGEPVTFTLEAPSNANAVIVGLALANPPIGADPVSDPTIVGSIRSERPVDGVTIEFDFDANDANGINGTTTTDVMGRFEFLPALEDESTNTIRARTREYDAAAAEWVFGDWSAPLAFDYESPDKAPGIASLDYQLEPFPEVPKLYGYVSNEATAAELDDMVVEFSYSNTTWSVIGSTEVAANRYFDFALQGLDPGQSYTVWARVKKPLTEGSSQFVYGVAISSDEFTYSPTAASSYLVSALLLDEDTDTGSGTAYDGATSNSRVVGSISGYSQPENVVIYFVLDDGSSQFQATVDSNGDFYYDFALSAPGYHHVRALASDGANLSQWRAVNFVFDSDDDSPPALALVQAFATIDPDWQTALEGFDHDFATTSADALYQLTLENADSNHDFQVAAAQLAREGAQRAADNAYRQQQLAAEAAYRAAIAGAQATFVTAHGALPAADQGNYSLKDFVWPDAPDDNRLVIPGDSQQPQPPAAPTYGGPTFDYQQSPIYWLGVNQANQTYQLAVREEYEEFDFEVKPHHEMYRTSVEGAYATYKNAVDQAQAAFEASRTQNPVFPSAEYEGLIEQIRAAWADYIEKVRKNGERHLAIVTDANTRMYEALNSEYEAENAEKLEAWQSFNEGDGPSELSEWNDYAMQVYQIDREYAPKYEKILNENARTVNGADRDLSVANAQALNATLKIVYPLRQQITELVRNFGHEELVDRLNDGYALTEDLAEARRVLEKALAEAARVRDRAIADEVFERDSDIAEHRKTRDQAISAAKLAAFDAWSSSVNTNWSAYQWQLAANENVYEQAVANLNQTRDVARAAAVKTESQAIAEAAKVRADAKAEAEFARTVDLADATRDFQIDVDQTYVTRDIALSEEWYGPSGLRLRLADARLTHQISTADITKEYRIANAEAGNAYSTAMPWGVGGGWAYNVPDYVNLGELLVNNEQTQLDLQRTYHRRTTKATLNSALAQADADEKYALKRIDEIEIYRKATNGAFSAATIAVADLQFVYQTGVAAIQDSYNGAIASAAAGYAIGVAKGEASRAFQEIAADGGFDNGEAPLAATRNVNDAGAKSSYEVGEAGDYVDALETWAEAVVTITPWEQYQISLAGAEKIRVQALGNADVARAGQLGEKDILWTNAIVSADLAYAAALYVEPEEGGAYVKRAEGMAGALAAIAGSDSLSDYVTAAATAVRDHDQGVAEKSLVFYDELAAADAERDREVAKAHFDYVRTRARADYAIALQTITQAQYEDLIEAAWRELAIRGAYADAARAVRVAEARRDWTAEVGKLNVKFVQDLVAAQVDRAARIAAERKALADAVGGAQLEYEITDATAVQVQTVAYATAVGVYSNAAAGIEAVYAAAVDVALSVKSAADALALGVYEVGLHFEHKLATAAFDTSDTTPLSEFQKQVAAADHAWAEARATARNAYYYHATNVDLSDIEAARTAAINTASIADAARSSAATLAHAIDQAATDRALTIGVATAEHDLYIGQKYAEAELIVNSTAPQGAADIAYAQAVAARDNAYADAGVEWVTTVVYSYVAYVTMDITWEEHQANIDAAELRRDEARDAADKAYDDAVDSAGVDEEQYLGAARMVYVGAAYTAKVEYVMATNPVYEDYAIDSAQNDVQLGRRIAQSTEIRENQLLAADYKHTLALAGLDVAHQFALVTPDVTRVAARAEAEAIYHAATADAETDDWADRVAANPGDEMARFHLAESSARADWFDELGDDYQAFQSALATADAEGNFALSQAIAVQQAAQAASAHGYGRWIAALQRIRTLSLLVPQSGSGVAAVRNENTSMLAIAETTRTHALKRATAQVEYDVAIDFIERDEELTYEQKDDARAEALYLRDVAFAEADIDWRSDAADAEFEFALEEAQREYDVLSREAAIERRYSADSASAAFTRDRAFAKAERAKMLADETARGDERSARALATADFQSAVYQSKVTALGELETGLPRANAPIQGIAAGYLSGDLTFTADWWNGAANEGEFTVNGSGFVKHASAGGGSVLLGSLNKGIAVHDEATGTGYILYSVQDVDVRFSVSADNSDHLIAVRYSGSQWQYNNDLSWVAFTPVAGDVLIAAVDFGADTIADLGGGILWARFQVDRAEAEQDAWEAVKDDYLLWQANVNAANYQYAVARADAYLLAAQTTAGLERSYEQTAAPMTQSHVVVLAGLQRDFALALADLVYGYRGDVAYAHYDYELLHALEVLTNDPSPTSGPDFTAAKEGYANGYVGLDHARRQAMAQAALEFVGATAELYQAKADLIADAQDAFSTAVNNAYYTASTGTSGLEEQLAAWAYAFGTLEAGTLRDKLAALATSTPTPFSELAAAESAERYTHVTQPLSELERDQRSSLAASENTYRAALNSADRASWMSQVAADSARATRGAAATLGFAANVRPAFDDSDLPLNLDPPLVDLPQITPVGNDYWIIQPGSIYDYWYYDYLGYSGSGWGWYHYLGEGYRYGYWYGDGWEGNSYWWDFDAYAYDWGYEGYGWGGYGLGYWGWGYGGYGGWGGGWYGGWGYYPGYYGWGGWSASYVAAPVGLSGDYEIDVKAELADHRDTIDDALAPIETAQSAAISTKDVTPPVIDPATGAGQLGDVPEPAQAPSLPPPPPEGGGGGAGFGEGQPNQGITLVAAQFTDNLQAAADSRNSDRATTDPEVLEPIAGQKVKLVVWPDNKVVIEVQIAGFFGRLYEDVTGHRRNDTSFHHLGRLDGGFIKLNDDYTKGKFATSTNVVSFSGLKHFLTENGTLIAHGGWSMTPDRTVISNAIREVQAKTAKQIKEASDKAPFDKSLGITLMAEPDGNVRPVHNGIDPRVAQTFRLKGLAFHDPRIGNVAADDALRPTQQQLQDAFYNQYLAIVKRDEKPGAITQALDSMQLLLDVAGLIPVLGAGPDVLNGAISAGRGDQVQASLSLLSAIPALGDSANIAKLVNRANKALDGIKGAEAAIDALRAAIKVGAEEKTLKKTLDTVKVNVVDAVLRGEISVADVNRALNRHIALEVAQHKPPLPDPIDVARIGSRAGKVNANHLVGAITEEVLAKIIHNLPDEVVVAWGGVIGSHGADVVSYNLKTGQVKLWDAKFRRTDTLIPSSSTFEKAKPLQDAIDAAIVHIKNNKKLPEDIRNAAISALGNKAYKTETVGFGRARTK